MLDVVNIWRMWRPSGANDGSRTVGMLKKNASIRHLQPSPVILHRPMLATKMGVMPIFYNIAVCSYRSTDDNLGAFQYLKYEMVALCIRRQNWGFDSHVYGQKWWCLNINSLEIFLLFRKFIRFHKLSCEWNVRRTKLGSLKNYVLTVTKRYTGY